MLLEIHQYPLVYLGELRRGALKAKCLVQECNRKIAARTPSCLLGSDSVRHANLLKTILFLTSTFDSIHLFFKFISCFLQLFSGNTISSELTSTNSFPGPVMARFVKFYPQSWHIFIALQVELYGCSAGKLYSGLLIVIT